MKSLKQLITIIRTKYQALPAGIRLPAILLMGLLIIIYIFIPDPMPLIDELVLIFSAVYLNWPVKKGDRS